MPLELHPNDNAREGQPSVAILNFVHFHGKSVVFLVIGVAVFVASFRILAALDIDWWINLTISLLPLIGIAAVIHCFVNGKPPSYIEDCLLFFLWRLRSRLYLAGALDRPPELWRVDQLLTHPTKI